MFKKAAIAIALAAAMTGAASAAVYNGNGATGFGGPLGNGSLTITDDGTNLYFQFNAGNNNNDYLVVYIDSVAGGLTSTAGINDFQDGNRRAISAGNQVIFGACEMDYAISTPGAGAWSNFAGLWGLVSPANNNDLPFVTVANIGGTQNNTTFNIPLSAIGITGPNQTINFVATYASDSGYLSNESSPASVAIPPLDGGGNPGFDGGLSFSLCHSYTTIPEPVSLSGLALGALLVARRRR